MQKDINQFDSPTLRQAEDHYAVLSTTETTQTSLTKPGDLFGSGQKTFQKIQIDVLEQKLKSLNMTDELIENTRKSQLHQSLDIASSLSSDSLNQTLYNFLNKIQLECLYETLTLNGYDDLSFLIEQMKIEPLNEEILTNLGVDKIGHRLIFLAFLEEETNKYFRRSFPIKSDCCVQETYKEVPELETWLDQIYLKETFVLFESQGFADLKQILFVMNSSYKINDEILKKIGIHKIGHRQRILFKLREDAESFNKKEFYLKYDAGGVNLGCGRCGIM